MEEKPTAEQESTPARRGGRETERSPSEAQFPPTSFARRLMKLLNDEEAADALWWLPDGKSFAIDPKTAPSKILDVHFRSTKFTSFVRRLHNR